MRSSAPKQALTLASALALLCGGPGTARADDEATCGGEPFRFALSDVKGRRYDGAESVTKAPVTLFFYQGYKSANVLENVRQALQHDPILGDGAPRSDRWAGFPIIDYKEGWFVPAWAIDKVLRDKMNKYPNTIFLQDKGECMTKSGTSPKCPGGIRFPHFKSNEGSVAVVYHGALYKKFAGKTDPGPFVELMRKLTAQAEKGASFCEMKKALESGE